MPYPYTNYPFNPYGMNYGNQNNMQPQAQAAYNNTYAFVNGVEGAKSYLVQPNQTVMLMDAENPVCYMKSSNSLGQSVLRYFKLQEVDEAAVRNLHSVSQPSTTQNTEATKYALQSDLDALSIKMDNLLKQFDKNTKSSKNVTKGAEE